MSRSLIKRNQLDKDVEGLISDVVYGTADLSTVVYTTGDQKISGNKDFIAKSRITISGETVPTPFVVFGHGMFNTNAGPGYNTNAVFEAYESGNLLADIKINNPSTAINSKAGLFLASPGNNVIIYTTPNSGGYQCVFSGSQFTHYNFQSNGLQRLLISGNRVIIGNITDNANGGNLQIPNGITFPATQVPIGDPNTLDDYEEGSWTPVIRGETNAGTSTYIIQNAYYIKIGKQVNIHGRITFSNIGTITGSLYIEQLPYAPDGISNNSQGTINFSYFNNLSTALVNMYGHTTTTSRINLFKLAGAATTSAIRLQHSDLGNTTDLIFAGFYRSNA